MAYQEITSQSRSDLQDVVVELRGLRNDNQEIARQRQRGLLLVLAGMQGIREDFNTHARRVELYWAESMV